MDSHFKYMNGLLLINYDVCSWVYNIDSIPLRYVIGEYYHVIVHIIIIGDLNEQLNFF